MNKPDYCYCLGCMALYYLPAEILCSIAQHLAPPDQVNLMTTCSLWRDTINANFVYILGLGSIVRILKQKTGYELYREQIVLLKAIQISNAKWNLFRAPMGSGKTAVMLSLGLCDESRCLYIINTRIYTSWIQELNNFGYYLNQDPKKSEVLIVHSKYPKHRGLVLNKGIPFRFKIVLTTVYYLQRNGYANMLLDWVNGGKLIVDEAHLLKINHINPLKRSRNVRHYWFSASHIPIESKNLTPDSVFSYQVKSIPVKDYPKLVLHTVKEPSSIEEQVLSRTKRYSRIVIFSNFQLRMLRNSAKRLNSLFQKYTILTFSNTATTILPRWKKADIGVLLCNYLTASEGTNFSEADCVVCFHFGYISSEKARQSIGRIRRKNSVHSKVRVFFVNNQSWEKHIKSKINQTYALNLNMELFEKKSEYTILYILAHMQRNGINPKKLSKEDILRIFTFSHNGIPTINFKKLTLPVETILMYSQV